MKKIITSFICFLGLTGLNAQSISTEEFRLIDGLQLDHQIAAEIKANTKNNFEVSVGQADREMLFEDYPLLKDYAKSLPKAIKIKVKSAEATELISRFKQQLEKQNLIIYKSEENNENSEDVITILQSKNRYEPLLFEATNAVNHDIYTPEIIERLKKWDQLYGITLYGVGMDYISGEFQKKPSDSKAFAAEMYEFCPDIVDQGVGDVKLLERVLKETNEFYLWWD